MPRAAPLPLARVRKICLSLPETTERASHDAPSFFIRDKVCFVNYMDDHHDDGRLALWCACPPGMREGLVKADPEHYFLPHYVGVRGWIGGRLERGIDGDAGDRVTGGGYLPVAPGKIARSRRS